VRYFKELNRLNISRERVKVIDGLILEHQHLFLRVPEYRGLWKPKHHFAQHVAKDILRYGPPRHYWCMGFEAYNQLIKNLAGMSNFKSPLLSVARFWIGKSARNLQRGCTSAFSAGEVCITNETSDIHTAAARSQFVAFCVEQVRGVSGLRDVCSFTRDGDTVCVGTWMVVSHPQVSATGARTDAVGDAVMARRWARRGCERGCVRSI